MSSSSTSRGRIGANLTWTLTGRVSYAAVQWLIVVVVARLGGAADVGLLALVMAIATPIMVFSQLSLRPLKATAGPDDDLPAAYFTLRLVATACGAVVTMLVAGVSALDHATVVVLAWVVLAKVFDNLSDVLYGFHQNLERHDLMSLSLTLRSLLALTVVAIGLQATGSLTVALALQAAAWAAVLVLFDIPQTARALGSSSAGRTRLFLAWNPSGWRRLVRLGVPLGIAAFLASFLSNVPRYFIEHHLGRTSLGQFAVMAYFVTFMVLVANSTAQAAAPRLGQALGRGDIPSFSRLLRRLRGVALGVSVLGIAIAILFGKPLLILVYGRSFGEVAPLLPLVMVAGGLSFAATFASYGLIAAREVKAMQWALAISTAACALASWVAVPALGLVGALLAWNLGLALQWLLSELALVRSRVLSGRPAD